MHKIFICYRRDDTGQLAIALNRELRHVFGDECLFLDVENLEGGSVWHDQIMSHITQTSAVMVLIGQRWLASSREARRPRLREPHDAVRLEIARAIETGARIIPVICDGTTMPSADQLPADIRQLAVYQAMVLRSLDWAHDFARICDTLASGSGFRARLATVKLNPGARLIDKLPVLAITLAIVATLVWSTELWARALTMLMAFAKAWILFG